MKDKYIPELVMSVIKKEPLALICLPTPDDSDWEEARAICLADLRRVLEDMFEED